MQYHHSSNDDWDKENAYLDLTSTIIRPRHPDKSFYLHSQELRTAGNCQLSIYAQDIEHLWKQQERLQDISNPLQRHNISTSARAKMVNWMVEVLHIFECSQPVFFLSVRLMDLFFKKTGRLLEPGDLHLLGLTSMFVASKFEDICALTMETVYERIGHRRFSKQEIRLMESELLSTLDYRIALPTVHSFLEKFITDVGRESLAGRTALALAELAMISWQLAVLPASKLAKAVQIRTMISLRQPVDVPKQGPEALALQEFSAFLENFWYNYQECRAVAEKYPGLEVGLGAFSLFRM